MSLAALLASSTYLGKKGRMALPTLSRQLFQAHNRSSYFRDVAIRLVRSAGRGQRVRYRVNSVTGVWSWGEAGEVPWKGLPRQPVQ